ncbi:glycerophosphodiester phosphodiesterase family protein [Arthrobacter sp. MSA 4-2]|uniref:glycerophosphodiester phosphodiesterase n=1 Tax=Arthrobacter sp. MSA 4-2 TaxID=2794349 RepID=UPI0027DD82F8|nr:glycerophosphodiester phosphodiesterase family protein [Arthrobacter sp. MSA 4-2]
MTHPTANVNTSRRKEPLRALLTGVMTLATLAAGITGAAAEPAKEGRTTVIAHRGASADAPENTLPAVDLGAAVKADFVEIDVQRTLDGELVVIHDTTLGRTTDVETKFPGRAPYRVADFTYAEISTLDAGSWFGPGFAGTQVPTLQQVLDTLHGRAGLLLEVKSPELYPGIGADIAAELDSEGWLKADARAGRLVVQSFNWDFMREFNALAPEVPAGLLGGPPAPAEYAELSTWADQINPSHTRVTSAFVDLVHQYGMETWPYTVDDPQRMRALTALGVDGIITNKPALLTDLLKTDAAATR